MKYLRVGKRYKLYFFPKRKFILGAKRVGDEKVLAERRELSSKVLQSYYEVCDRTNRVHGPVLDN